MQYMQSCAMVQTHICHGVHNIQCSHPITMLHNGHSKLLYCTTSNTVRNKLNHIRQSNTHTPNTHHPIRPIKHHNNENVDRSKLETDNIYYPVIR
jgi:hypothetical protein